MDGTHVLQRVRQKAYIKVHSLQKLIYISVHNQTYSKEISRADQEGSMSTIGSQIRASEQVSLCPLCLLKRGIRTKFHILW